MTAAIDAATRSRDATEAKAVANAGEVSAPLIERENHRLRLDLPKDRRPAGGFKGLRPPFRRDAGAARAELPRCAVRASTPWRARRCCRAACRPRRARPLARLRFERPVARGGVLVIAATQPAGHRLEARARRGPGASQLREQEDSANEVRPRPGAGSSKELGDVRLHGHLST